MYCRQKELMASLAFTSVARPGIFEFSVASGHRKFENSGPSERKVISNTLPILFLPGGVLLINLRYSEGRELCAFGVY